MPFACPGRRALLQLHSSATEASFGEQSRPHRSTSAPLASPTRTTTPTARLNTKSPIPLPSFSSECQLRRVRTLVRSPDFSAASFRSFEHHPLDLRSTASVRPRSGTCRENVLTSAQTLTCHVTRTGEMVIRVGLHESWRKRVAGSNPRPRAWPFY